MKSYIIHEEQIEEKTIGQFKMALNYLAKSVNAEYTIIPCLEIRTGHPVIMALLDQITGIGLEVSDLKIVDEKVKKPRKNMAITNGICSQCGREAQLVKALGICKPCHMNNKRKGISEKTLAWQATEERIEKVVQAAKARNVDPLEMPHADSGYPVAVRKF